MSTHLDSLKDRIFKLKNKIFESLRGSPDQEDLQIYLSLIEKDFQHGVKDFKVLERQIESLKSEVDSLKYQLKTQNSKIEDLNSLQKVVKECVLVYRKIVYSERFVNKELLERAQSATTLLELSLSEDSLEKTIPKKINLYK